MHGIIEEAYDPPKGRHSPQNPESDGPMEGFEAEVVKSMRSAFEGRSAAAEIVGREFAKIFKHDPPERMVIGDGAVLGAGERDLSAIFWENPLMEPACMAKSPDPMAVTMPDADDSRAHEHYFKNVGHLDVVDVYRVLDLFEVTDQALGHAVKKLLVAGGRGVKNVHRDVQDAIDTLLRWQEMQRENVALPRIAGASN